MDDQYQSFKVFNTRELAEDFAEVLRLQNIPYLIDEDKLVFDVSFANSPLNKDYVIKILQKDFEAANKAYHNYFATLLNNVDRDYYLFTFTDDELKEILAKPDEWGVFDYELSQKILNERGVHISEEEKDALKSSRYKQLEAPEKERTSNIWGYYVISLFIPVGLVIGWIWAYSKKQLPDGRRVYAYDNNTRWHGRLIFKITMVLLILGVLLKVFGFSNN